MATLAGVGAFGAGLQLPGSGLLSAGPASSPRPAVMQTVAGGGSVPGTDGGDPLAAQLNRPEGIAVAPNGSVYVADSFHHRVWEITREGTLALVAGTGTPGFSGDSGSARDAQLNVPEGLAVGPDGSLYIGDTVNRRVRRVAGDGTITTVAGTGERGYSGDGGAATSARLTDPNDLAVATNGTLFVLDEQGGEIRRVNPDGTIDTLSLDLTGGSSDGATPDGSGPSGVATPNRPGEARHPDVVDQLGAGPSTINPFGIAVDRAGTLYVSDGTAHRVWRQAADETWLPFAGTGLSGFEGDGGPAANAQLNRPEGIAAAPDGSVYIADRNNHRVRKVGRDGAITTVAGTGERGYSGDGGPALAANLDQPLRVAAAPHGEVYVTDLGNQRIRAVKSPAATPPAPTTPTPTTAATSLPEQDPPGEPLPEEPLPVGPSTTLRSITEPPPTTTPDPVPLAPSSTVPASREPSPEAPVPSEPDSATTTTSPRSPTTTVPRDPGGPGTSLTPLVPPAAPDAPAPTEATTPSAGPSPGSSGPVVDVATGTSAPPTGVASRSPAQPTGPDAEASGSQRSPGAPSTSTPSTESSQDPEETPGSTSDAPEEPGASSERSGEEAAAAGPEGESGHAQSPGRRVLWFVLAGVGVAAALLILTGWLALRDRNV